MLAKFHMGGANPMLPISLTSAPRGIAINGELRAAQTIRIVDLSANVRGTATFLEGTPSQNSWRGTMPIATFFGIQTMEVCYNAQGEPAATLCVPSLDVRSRLVNFDTSARQCRSQTYSRGRSVLYREILRAPLTDPDAPTSKSASSSRVPTDLSAGTACVVGGTPPRGSALLRDPWPHDVFSFDGTLAFYGGDDGGIMRTRVNDTIVVNRGDPKYYMQIVKPSNLTVGQIGSALPITVSVSDPSLTAACGPVSGLNERPGAVRNRHHRGPGQRQAHRRQREHLRNPECQRAARGRRPPTNIGRIWI